MLTKRLFDHEFVVDHEEHRRTCVVCSTLGVRRAPHEFTVREFTPAGEIIQLTITQTIEPLEEQDIRWILEHATSLFSPLKVESRKRRLSSRSIALVGVVALLVGCLVTLLLALSLSV